MKEDVGMLWRIKKIYYYYMDTRTGMLCIETFISFIVGNYEFILQVLPRSWSKNSRNTTKKKCVSKNRKITFYCRYIIVDISNKVFYSKSLIIMDVKPIKLKKKKLYLPICVDFAQQKTSMYLPTYQNKFEGYISSFISLVLT